MKFVPANLGLPLLTKELLEQAARPRTYIFRTAYACLLFVGAYWAFQEVLAVASSSPFAALGQGRNMFQSLMKLQFYGILLFMPALTCGAITQEKERDSLALLFLTRLGPWAIVFEKLLSRLIPMFTFLMLGLPLLAFAYSLGGITQADVASGIWLLILAIVQVGTLSLACSAFYRTTAGAFVGTYLWGGLFLLFGSCCFSGLSAGPRAGSPNIPITVVMTFNTLFGSFVCLAVARVSLVERAFIPPQNVLLNIFRELDKFFTTLNDNPLTRGVVLIRESTGLPREEPIAWRETTKKSLGTVRYLFRVFVALEFPVAFACTLAAGAGRGNFDGLSGLLFLLWPLALLLVAVHAAGLVSAERTHQTLDVLVTTPLGGREILRQKFRGVWRLLAVLSVPFATIFFFEAWLRGTVRGYYSTGDNFDVASYLTASALSVVIYLPLAAWLSAWIGLRSRTQIRAMLFAIGIIVGWCGLEGLLAGVPFVSPVWMVRQIETSRHSQALLARWVPIVANFVIYGACLVFVRRRCLADADRLFGPGRRWEAS